jgi:hypothetical protein
VAMMMSSATTTMTIYQLWSTGECPIRDGKSVGQNVSNAVMTDAKSNITRSRLPRVLLKTQVKMAAPTVKPMTDSTKGMLMPSG